MHRYAGCNEVTHDGSCIGLCNDEVVFHLILYVVRVIITRLSMTVVMSEYMHTEDIKLNACQCIQF